MGNKSATTPRVLVLLGEGFEEIETVTPVDLLRRAGATVTTAAAGSSLTVRGRSGITIMADQLIGEIDTEEFDALILPGGPGVAALRAEGIAARLAARFHARGQWVAAICAAPALLADAGLIEDIPFTCHESVAKELTGADLKQRVVIAKNILTSRGAGTALDFALALVRVLFGPEKESQIAASIMA